MITFCGMLFCILLFIFGAKLEYRENLKEVKLKEVEESLDGEL